jgi:hypothetical protein
VNFTFVNPHNVEWLVPHWVMNPFEVSVELEQTIRELPVAYRPSLRKHVPVYFYFSLLPNGDWRVA